LNLLFIQYNPRRQIAEALFDFLAKLAAVDRNADGQRKQSGSPGGLIS
jgi:aminoglycoside phosphotransferase (APT) family kinase protein